MLWEVKIFLDSLGILVDLTKNIRVLVSMNSFEHIKGENGNSGFKVPLSLEKMISFQFYLYSERKFWFCFRKPKRTMPFF